MAQISTMQLITQTAVKPKMRRIILHYYSSILFNVDKNINVKVCSTSFYFVTLTLRIKKLIRGNFNSL